MNIFPLYLGTKEKIRNKILKKYLKTNVKIFSFLFSFKCKPYTFIFLSLDLLINSQIQEKIYTLI